MDAVQMALRKPKALTMKDVAASMRNLVAVQTERTQRMDRASTVVLKHVHKANMDVALMEKRLQEDRTKKVVLVSTPDMAVVQMVRLQLWDRIKRDAMIADMLSMVAVRMVRHELWGRIMLVVRRPQLHHSCLAAL
ncbi:hypothetical protein Tcan_02742 [Toxocara canis]|uniref:Uncharacterized protein n=1 Tax=Toxocara canis TaxID=6265 RepID=A0A0B2VH16_TOXCA|nr:hypothetical protein Tcan_02742 [Toxocara canis]